MASEQLTPSSYIEHHLGFNAKPVGDGNFWVLHMDTLVMSALLGVIVFGFLWWVVRGATSGVPTKRQAFVELTMEFVDNQVKSIFGEGVNPVIFGAAKIIIVLEHVKIPAIIPGFA